MMKLHILALLVAVNNASALVSNLLGPMIIQINDWDGPAYRLNPWTPQILESFIAPLTVQLERNSYVYRHGAELRLDGQPWTASGANVYWLGLDENVRPPPGGPFYAPLNASYPTFGRITEVMKTLQTMGARVIRSQTLGVSVGNPLSVMPALGEYNEQAFATIDWSVFQARQHGLRIVAPLVDNYVCRLALVTVPKLMSFRITTTEESSISCAFEASTSAALTPPNLTPSCSSFTTIAPSSRISRTTSNI